MNVKVMNQKARDEQEKLKLYCLIGLFLGCSLMIDPSFAVTVEALKAPMTALKNQIFGGWMVAVQIGAIFAGIVMSAFRGSLAPVCIGAGLMLGIQLYDTYLGDVAAGALI